MSIDNEYLSKKIDEISAQIGDIEQKIIFNEKNTEIEINKQKELIIKAIKLHSENLKEFYDKTLEAQLDKFEVSYKQLGKRQQELLELEYNKKVTLEKSEVIAQKEFYEKELENLKLQYENRIEKQINDLTKWHLDNLEEKLDKQRDSYDKDLKNKLSLQKELLENEYQNKLNEQKHFYEEEANKKFEQEKDKLSDAINKRLKEQETWFKNNFKLINKNSPMVKIYEKLIKATKKN